MAKIYGLYRMIKTKTKEWWQDRHSPSFYLNNELEDYIQAGIFSIHDMEIWDEQYTNFLAPWIKNQARFFRAEYNEQYVTPEYLDMVLNKRLSTFYIEERTTEEARQWLRNNTSLEELETWVFRARESEEWIDELLITID